MKIGTNAWVLGMMLAGACDPFGGKEDDGGSDAGEATDPTFGSASATSVTGWGEDGASTATHGDDGAESHGTTGVESCSVTVGSDTDGVSATSTSATDGSDGGGGTTGGGVEAACGLDLEHGPYNSSYVCGCEQECSFQWGGLSPASGNALLDACDCICDYYQCGPSITGGVTGGGGSDDEGTASATSGWEEDDDSSGDGSAETEDGPAATGGSSGGGYGSEG